MAKAKKILVPLDGSKYSKKVIQYACDFSIAFDAEIILIYVVEKSMPVNLLDQKEYLKILRKFGKKTLDNAKSILTKKQLDAKIILAQGNIVNEINKTAKKEKCDLIIVGNKGLGAVGRVLLGSVSNKLAQSSACSLVIVK